MGIFKKVKKFGKKILPAAGAVVGGIYGGPGGASLGASLGGALSGKGSSPFGGTSILAQSGEAQSPWYGSIGGIWDSVSKYLPQISSAAGAVAPFYSAYASGKGAREANEWNMAASERQMDYGREMAGRQEAFQREQVTGQQAFNSAQSAQQMAFQREMAGTARQREVADLRSAGLNPMMASMNGAPAPMGASAASSAASGASGGGSQLPPYQSPTEKRLNSAAATATLVANLRHLEAETDKSRSEAERNRAEVPVQAAQESKLRVETRILTDRLNDHMPIERALLVAQVAVEEARKLTEGARYDESVFHSKVYREMVDEIAARTKLTHVERRLLEAELPKALAAAKEYSGPLGTASPWIHEMGQVLNSAGSASWVYRNARRR